ncbi:hypothetical protein NC653_038411 [Populus alba x Populus x berolinensis]|uniref:Uncharacterized protein n=1 Tax=Populus alba x Populus x berolinensis TaxID=444605 RepID=A0AAD6LGU5_9ROSI|nr:hypothetical protein NC653_038411 [Populus alba x Populus x berolinensis]
MLKNLPERSEGQYSSQVLLTCIHSFHLPNPSTSPLLFQCAPPHLHPLSLQPCVSAIDYTVSRSPFLARLQVIFLQEFYSKVVAMMTMGLGSLVMNLKSKIRSLKMKKPYDKIEKSDSMRVEIRSRKAKKLIEETLKIADSPGKKTYAL